MSDLLYKSIDDVPKVMALGGTIPTRRFSHDVTNEDLHIPANPDDHNQETINAALRKICAHVCTLWDAKILVLAEENYPCLLVETMHRRIVTGGLPEGVACRIEWQIGVFKEVDDGDL